MRKDSSSSASGSTSVRRLRPLPARQRAASRVPVRVNLDNVIVLTDSESDDSDNDVEIVQRPTKRQKTKSDISDTLTHDIERLIPKQEPALSAAANEPAQPAQSQVDDEPTIPAFQAEPEEDVDLIDRYLAQVLEIVPDVDPSHARVLLMQCLDKQSENASEIVLHQLFESPYPKVDRKGKGKRKHSIDEGAETNDNGDDDQSNEDYTKTDRPKPKGRYYRVMTLNQLRHDFPERESKVISKVLKANGNLYAPTFFALSIATKAGDAHTQTPSTSRAAGIMKAPVAMQFGKGKMQDPDFEIEFSWVVRKIQKNAQSASSQDWEGSEEYDNGEVDDDSGTSCGCCFSNFKPERMISCPADHLFCGSCIRQYAATKLGELDPYIKCMDQSGCKILFNELDLKRPLSSKLVDLYDRVKMTKDIEAAGLEGLEECPFCEYKVIIENEDEKLVHCQSEDCGATSCRKCKKADHLPKSCEEAEADKGLNARHKVEEAMTSALMRNCPQCKKSFVKEYGCNKMTCPNCKALSCYVCRQLIKGYDHFYDSGGRGRAGAGPSVSTQGKCSLWEETEALHLKEVTAARERIIKEMVADPTIDRSQLNVELPKAGPSRQTVAAARPPPAAAARHHLREQMVYGGAPGNIGFGVDLAERLFRVPRALPQQVHHHFHHQIGPPHVHALPRPLQPQQQLPQLPMGGYVAQQEEDWRQRLDERQAELRRHMEEERQRMQRILEDQRRHTQEANAAIALLVAQQQEEVRRQWNLMQRNAPAIHAVAQVAPAPAFQQPQPAGQMPPLPFNFGFPHGQPMGQMPVPLFPFGQMPIVNLQPNPPAFNPNNVNNAHYQAPPGPNANRN